MKISLVSTSAKSTSAANVFQAFIKSFGEPARSTDTKAAWSGVPCGGIIAFCKSKKMKLQSGEMPTNVVMVFENSKVQVQIKKRSFVVMSK